jgi:hypothetical protein
MNTITFYLIPAIICFWGIVSFATCITSDRYSHLIMSSWSDIRESVTTKQLILALLVAAIPVVNCIAAGFALIYLVIDGLLILLSRDFMNGHPLRKRVNKPKNRTISTGIKS